MRLVSCPERNKMIDGTLTKKDVLNLLGVGGGGVHLIPLYPQDSEQIVVDFSHIFDTLV